MSANRELILKGLAVSKGIAIGKAFFLSSMKEEKPKEVISEKEITLEIKKYRKAIRESEKDLLQLQKMFEKEKSPTITEILGAQLQLLQDPFFIKTVVEKIRVLKKSSQYVFQKGIDEYKKRFKKVKDEFFKERIKDITDVSNRILKHLRQTKIQSIESPDTNFIIIANEITPTEVAQALSEKIQAFVTQEGSTASHAVIIAKAKKIPFVANIDLSTMKDVEIQKMIVDGIKGYVILNPSENTLKKYRLLLKKLQKPFTEKENSSSFVTKDGTKVQVFSTLEVFSDVDVALKYHAKGIGIFRSEFLFLTENIKPTEKEQFIVYRQIAQKLKNKPFIIRVFDIGGEKDFSLSHFKEKIFFSHEKNPLFGCHSIRFLLHNKKILKTQLKAILRASPFGNLQILLPMVSEVEELQQVKQLLEICKKELTRKKIPFSSSIPIGVMVEIPASAMISDLLLEEADFLSIGSNDLMQFSLAADRNSSFMKSLYHFSHPGILRILLMIFSLTVSYKKPVFLCGEMAADSKLFPLLLAIGYRYFSVGSYQLAALQKVIKNISLSEAKKTWRKILENK